MWGSFSTGSSNVIFLLGTISFSPLPALNPILHFLFLCTSSFFAAYTVSSDDLVGEDVRFRSFVRVLCAVLQPIGEVGIGVCALSVRLAVVVGGDAYTSVTSPVSGMFSSMCGCSSPSVVWLSEVIVITVCSWGSLIGILGKILLELSSACCWALFAL